MLLELRSTGQQTVFPGSVHECGEAIEWANEDVLRELPARDLIKAAGRLAAASFLRRRWNVGRDDLATALIGALLRDGWTPEEADSFVAVIAKAAGDEELLERMKAHALSKALAAKSGRVPGWPTLGELLGKLEADKLQGWLLYDGSSDADKEHVDRLNARHAVVMIGGQCRILNEVVDPVTGKRDITLSAREDLRTKYANVLVPRGRKHIPVIDVWLTDPRRREYEGIVFAPGVETPRHYNLWRGFAVEPREGDCSLYLAHLRDNIASGDEAVFKCLLDWMADAVQNPTRRPGVAIVLQGKQGTGKGVMCTEFGKLFGQHFVHVQSTRHITGNFNAHLKDALVVFADEAFWAGDKSAEGVLKGMVTEEKLAIEFKGRDVTFVQNHIRLLVASNHDWVVPAGAEERRFFVLDVGDTRIQDAAYFRTIVEQMNAGGREALLHFLATRDLSRADVRKFPQTRALMENKIHSMPPVQRFWLERLRNGALIEMDDQWRDAIPVSELHDAYLKELGGTSRSHLGSSTQFGMALRKMVPGLRRDRREVNGRRVWCYVVPSLEECRAAFDRAMRFDWPWPEGGAATRAPSEM